MPGLRRRQCLAHRLLGLHRRITSYNVCYTKLLRLFSLACTNIETLPLEKRVSRLHLAGLLLGLLLSLLYAQHQILTGDQAQMLCKGYLGTLEGIWLSYGNAASALGNVPGSLSTYLVGLPLLLWNSPQAPMMLLIALRLVSYLLFDDVIRQVRNNFV